MKGHRHSQRQKLWVYKICNKRTKIWVQPLHVEVMLVVFQIVINF